MVILVEWLLNNFYRESNKEITVVEFCAGSGFVGLPIAYRNPKVKVCTTSRDSSSTSSSNGTTSSSGNTDVVIMTAVAISKSRFFRRSVREKI